MICEAADRWRNTVAGHVAKYSKDQGKIGSLTIYQQLIATISPLGYRLGKMADSFDRLQGNELPLGE
tara:strand:+ start:195 stop:395 length:201 start_codon:yes stop_codon:yes gene_type:complete